MKTLFINEKTYRDLKKIIENELSNISCESGKPVDIPFSEDLIDEMLDRLGIGA